MIFDSHEAGGWKAVYVSATAGEVTGADAERGIELFNRRSVDRGLREWPAPDLSLVGAEGRLKVGPRHGINKEHLRYRREHY